MVNVVADAGFYISIKIVPKAGMLMLESRVALPLNKASEAHAAGMKLLEIEA